LHGFIKSVISSIIEPLYPCIHPYVCSWIDGLFDNVMFFVLVVDQHNHFFMVQVGVMLARSITRLGPGPSLVFFNVEFSIMFSIEFAIELCGGR
jgi:hypothetical protein